MLPGDGPAQRRVPVEIMELATMGYRVHSSVLRSGVAVCLLLGGTGCERSATPVTRDATTSALAVIDDAGDTLRLAAPATRVLALVPSVTDLLIALDVAPRIVGRTRYDVDPRTAMAPDVGGGLDPNIEAIVGLKPEVVFTWASDKRAELAQQLRAAGVGVFAIAQQDTADAFRSITQVARILGRDSAGVVLSDSLRRAFHAVAASVTGRPRPRVFYVVSADPPMGAGPATFIGQLLEVAGARNVVAPADGDWPVLSMETVLARNPDVLVLPRGESADASGDLLRERAGWKALRAVQAGRVVQIDANLANRPGPRMGEAAALLRDLLHPDAVSARP